MKPINSFVLLLKEFLDHYRERTLRVMISQWLDAHRKSLNGGEPYLTSVLKLAEIGISDIFLSPPTAELLDEVRRFVEVPPSNIKSLLMRIRDILWMDIATEGNILVDGAEVSGYFLWDSQENCLVLESMDGRLFQMNGHLYENKQNRILLPASKYQILEATKRT
ncbi:hypothetical protein [Deinococcus cellulosilyticus]|uniref:Uncharacterized protein n=1 Tax=Deinococcus cellulosilyticus (strain DSM 18568 / NBRC 106333 / KACC 11606 / 5516J-15) TaxID=1223518 RepID=A0A511NAX6_DEIC1|nr:hypothetical protein [Deinococcus cellulosilyticus]GEM49979.1 hypothetical protein DC3_56140 [Deinococcus cellulosilyticus NBRC 106333 = KACC 11606]